LPFYEDVTPEALAQNSATGWPSSSLWSDESGLVIGGHGMSDESAMRFLGLLNRFWDGSDFERHRTTAKSFTITGRRLSCSLMMQEIVLAKLLSAGGGASRGMGFLARFLFAWPQSTMGGRFYRIGDMECPELAAYDRRITHLLDHKLPTEGQDMALAPPVIPLDDDARAVWIEFHDDVEKQLGRLGDFRDVTDFAAKCAENAARIAGVFSCLRERAGGEHQRRHDEGRGDACQLASIRSPANHERG
jgi:putative DNA primase/helicase